MSSLGEMDVTPEVDALASQCRSWLAAGDLSRAYETGEQCLDLLLNRRDSEVKFQVSLLDKSDAKNLRQSSVIVEASGRNRKITIPAEVFTRNIGHVLIGLDTVRRMCETDAVSSVSAGQVIWELGDGSFEGQYPQLAFCSSLENAFLVADSYFIQSHGYEDLRAAISARWIPWDDRKPMVFWRGSTTGQQRYTPERGNPVKDWAWLQRLHLCDAASKSFHRHRLDIGVVGSAKGGFAQIPDASLADSIRKAGFERPRCGRMDFFPFRYLIDIDGNANSWNGLFGAMLMGATVLKVRSPQNYRQWYYGKLVPWEHYIPLRSDLADFDEHLEWAFTHPAECEAMGRSIKALADSLTYDSELQYSADVVRRALESSGALHLHQNAQKGARVMSVSRSEIVAAYRGVLGRNPESEKAIAAHLDAPSLEALLKKFIGSPEFASRRPADKPLNWPPMAIDVDVSSAEIRRMHDRVQATWTSLGDEEPYWSVLINSDFRSNSISENRDRFYETGRRGLGNLDAFMKRSGFEPSPNLTCFELGCGVGRITASLAARFSRVLAADISGTHLSIAEKMLCQKDINNVTLIHLRNPEELVRITGFDIFVSLLVFQHNPPPIMAFMLEKILGNLKPGGFGFFQIPTYRKGYSFNLHKYLSFEGRGHHMEMHVLPQDRIFRIIGATNCQLLEVREDSSTGDTSGISNTFLVKKFTPGPPTT